jgi:carboxyl-terminal processing protease
VQIRSGVLLVAGLCGCATAQAPPVQPAAPPYDPAVGLETFDRAWQIVYQTHFDTTFNGVNWLALRDELRPRAAAAKSTEALRAVLSDMVGRLGQSHFALIPRELADTLDPGREPEGAAVGDLGFDTRLLDDTLVVTSVEAGSPADSAGIRPGWVVVRIDKDSVARVLTALRGRTSRLKPAFVLWSWAQARLNGAVGSTCTLELADAGNHARTVRLTRRPQPSEPVKFGNLPTFFARAADSVVRTPAGREAGWMEFNFWMAPLLNQLDDAVDRFRGLDGMVVDLRGNRGGLGGMIIGVAGHFFTERALLGTFQTRRQTLQIRANPRLVRRDGTRVQPYAGPVAILVDETSGSASEVFAGGMQAVGRARVFGETSVGGVLPAVTDRLPNGDVLYHAFAEFVTATGVHLEGRGVVPDEPVPLRRADLLAGRDPALDAALAWIDSVHAAGGHGGSQEMENGR